MKNNLIQVKILRYNKIGDKKRHYQLYEIPCRDEKMTIMEVFDYINKHLDASFAYRKYNCNRGTCHSCLIKLNGRNVRACSSFIGVGETAVIDPFIRDKVIKDVVCQF